MNLKQQHTFEKSCILQGPHRARMMHWWSYVVWIPNVKNSNPFSQSLEAQTNRLFKEAGIAWREYSIQGLLQTIFSTQVRSTHKSLQDLQILQGTQRTYRNVNVARKGKTTKQIHRTHYWGESLLRRRGNQVWSAPYKNKDALPRT